MKRYAIILAVILALAMLAACSPAATPTETVQPPAQSEAASEIVASDEFSAFDLETEFDDTTPKITFDGDSVSADIDGVTIEGTTVTITKKGVYVLSGTLSDGQIIVEADKADDVRLVLNGFKAASSVSAPIWVKSADKVVLTLADGSENTLSDAAVYQFDAGMDEPNACVFSKDDLTINGTGLLTVTGNYNNGIGSKNDLTIVSGSVSVSCVKNALKGNDSVTIGDGRLKLVSTGGDGIKADTVDTVGKGYVKILGGEIDISSDDDGIQAATDITISGGMTTITCVDQATVSDGTLNIDENCLVVK